MVSSSGAKARVYLDGDLAAIANISVAPGTGASSFEIASYSNGTSSTFNNARIDEVALWSQALTPIQVRGHYLAGRSVAVDMTSTTYDAEWHPIQVADQLLSSPGFESGVADWDFGTGSGGTVYFASSDGDPNVYSGFASFKTGVSGNVQQDVQLVPGQTFRFQVWERRTGAARAIMSVYWWNTDTGSWSAFISTGRENTSWTSHAWDFTLPLNSDGRVRVALWTNSGSGSDTVYFDDAAIITSYSRTTYTAAGLTDTIYTFSPASNAEIAEIAVKSTYAASSAHPGIFPTTVTANRVDGTFDPAVPDEDVVTTFTYDTWGRELTRTDADGVKTTTAYVASGTGFQTDIASTKNGLNNVTAYTYDAVGNRFESP